MIDFNEADFEKAAQQAHERLGPASPPNLDAMLQSFGIFVNTDAMVDRSKIEIDLVKLVTGERVLRLSDPRSGLALEKKLDAAQPVTRQKEWLLGIFETALARAEAIAA